jgi:tetratricopeptide (TPR) repeat protein
MQNPRLAKLFEFLESDPKDSFLLYAIATEYNAQADQQNALKYYLQLVAEHPSYVGTYYHLGKLYEQLGQAEQAISIYQQGMAVAKEKREMHAFSELQGAYNSAAGLDDDDDY